MKNNHFGKASIWSSAVIRKMRQGLKLPRQRLIFEISLYTGERVGAIVKLKVSDVYDDQGKVLEYITFGRGTRKASKHGVAATRQIFIHDDLRLVLEQYNPPSEGYLFASNSSWGHITPRAVDDYWRRILVSKGIKGFSTHSSRRWVINELRRRGVEISVIAETMAINIATVRRYLDDDPVLCKRAIATLST